MSEVSNDSPRPPEGQDPITRRAWSTQRQWQVAGMAAVLKGVTIGDDAIIGAGAVVTRNVPANCVAAGNPARVVRKGVTWRPELL